VTPETISVAGSDEALSEFKAAGKRIIITSESRAVDISGASGDVEIRVNITDYLPAGIRLASGFSDTVLVSVKILEFNTKSIEIDTKNIEKTNLGDNLNAVFDNPTVDIRVKGSDKALSELSAETISAEVDLSGISAGTFMLPVTVELPAGISLAEEPQAEITITETTVMQQPDSVPAG
jgi:YbbR domain-containing protein